MKPAEKILHWPWTWKAKYGIQIHVEQLTNWLSRSEEWHRLWWHQNLWTNHCLRWTFEVPSILHSTCWCGNVACCTFCFISLEYLMKFSHTILCLSIFSCTSVIHLWKLNVYDPQLTASISLLFQKSPSQSQPLFPTLYSHSLQYSSAQFCILQTYCWAFGITYHLFTQTFSHFFDIGTLMQTVAVARVTHYAHRHGAVKH